MTRKFKIGDHARWNSEAGHVTGKIIAVHTFAARASALVFSKLELR